MMRRISIFPGLLVFALMVEGCSSEGGKVAPAEKVKVVTEVIGYKHSGSRYYTGTVEALTTIPLSFLIPGQVEMVLVSEGQQVKRGDRLAVLDLRSYKNALDMAVAKEQQAEDAYRRLSELYRKGSLPEIKFIEAETGLSQARSAAEIARKSLTDCSLISPADGVIGKRQVEPGSSAVPYNTILTLIDIREVLISFPVPEKEIATTSEGQEATVEVPALNGEVFRGRITERGVVANPVTHTYTARVRLPNPGGRLMPGMVCKVRTGGADTASLVIIPLQTILTDGAGGKYVYLAGTGERPLRRTVNTGAVRGEGVTVTGLQPGDRLIVSGHQHLHENSTLEILK